MTFKKGNTLRKGKKAWNSGLTKETDERVAKIAKNISIGVIKNYKLHPETKTNAGTFKKGNNLRKGKHHTEETKALMKIKHINMQIGQDNGHWKGGKYPIKLPGWKRKSREALARAGYCSELSGANGGKLDVHHIISRRTFCDIYFDLMYNGIIDNSINKLLGTLVKKRRNRKIIPMIYPIKLFDEFNEPTNLIVLTAREHQQNEDKLPSFFVNLEKGAL